jgi:hypothetical protein
VLLFPAASKSVTRSVTSCTVSHQIEKPKVPALASPSYRNSTGLKAKGEKSEALITSNATQLVSPSGSRKLTIPSKEVPSAGISDGKSIEISVGGPGTGVGEGVAVAVGSRVGVEVGAAVGGTVVAVAVGAGSGVAVGIAVGSTAGVAVEVGVIVGTGVGNARSNASMRTSSASAAHCSHSSSLIGSGGLGGCPGSAAVC